MDLIKLYIDILYWYKCVVTISCGLMCFRCFTSDFLSDAYCCMNVNCSRLSMGIITIATVVMKSVVMATISVITVVLEIVTKPRASLK